MAAMFALEKIGLNAEKDHITVSSLGDQRLVSQALESGTIDAGLLTGTFSLRLKQIGFSVLWRHRSYSTLVRWNRRQGRNSSVGDKSRQRSVKWIRSPRTRLFSTPKTSPKF